MSTKRKTILFLVAFLIFSFLFIFFLIFPNLNQINKISKEISQTKIKFERIEKLQKEIEKFKKLSLEIRGNLSKLESSFVNREIPIDFVEFLENVAKGLEIQAQISILSSSKDSISFQIKGVGVPENVFKFFEKIENCNYLIQIERMRISKLTEAELKMKEFEKFSKNSLKFEISFSVLTK
jgi:hypothetical protein